MYLRVISDTQPSALITKWGSFIAGESQGQRNYKFEKLLLGPQDNIAKAAMGHVVRKVTGENVPLTKVTLGGQSTTYYASQGKHIVTYKLQPNEQISLESESVLAFTADCAYDIRFLGIGVISQRGFITTTLTGNGPNALVAFLSDGNPIVVSNTTVGGCISCDPDAVIGWVGQGLCDPRIDVDLNWKTAINQASGESYMFVWDSGSRASVILQPNERPSGLNIGIDSGNLGQQAQLNQQQTLTQTVSGVQGQMGQASDMLGAAAQFLGKLGV